MRRFIIAALLIIGAVPQASAQTGNYGMLTCGDFLASGHDNMAVIIWWLRGHHAGKTGVNSFDPKDAYAKRLGNFCGSHRGANLIDTSERILTELDHGI